MKLDIPYILSDLFDLTKFDPTYSEEKYNNLLKHKNQLSIDGLNQDDYLHYFKDFPLVLFTIRILFNYIFLLNEFENGDHPIFKGIKELKKHSSSLETYIKSMEKTLKILSLFKDEEGTELIIKTIKFLRQFQDNPEDFINRLYFFQILKSAWPNKIPDLSDEKLASMLENILVHNPYSDSSVTEWENCNFYLGLLELLDGYNINAEMLLTSAVIKIHKLFDLFNQDIYTKRNNPSKVILSIFEKMGKNPKINLVLLHTTIPKTFYKSHAVFDYKDENQNYIINPYFDTGLKKTFDFIATQNRLNQKPEISSDYDQAYENWMNRIYLQLILF